MTTGLIRFTQRARAEPKTRFTALMGLLFDPQGLHASFERQDGKKAPGVDGIQYVPRSSVNDSRWEPSGVTHHARFYEGGGAYPLRGSPPLLSNSARTDLCGGRSVMSVPTANIRTESKSPFLNDRFGAKKRTFTRLCVCTHSVQLVLTSNTVDLEQTLAWCRILPCHFVLAYGATDAFERKSCTNYLSPLDYEFATDKSDGKEEISEETCLYPDVGRA